MGSGIAGALVGLAVPPHVQGMDFALTALFVVLTYDASCAGPDWSLLAAAGVCLAAALLFPDQLLMVALTVYFVFVLARHFSPQLDSALRREKGPRSQAARADVSRETTSVASAGIDGK